MSNAAAAWKIRYESPLVYCWAGSALWPRHRMLLCPILGSQWRFERHPCVKKLVLNMWGARNNRRRFYQLLSAYSLYIPNQSSCYSAFLSSPHTCFCTHESLSNLSCGLQREREYHHWPLTLYTRPNVPVFTYDTDIQWKELDIHVKLCISPHIWAPHTAYPLSLTPDVILTAPCIERVTPPWHWNWCLFRQHRENNKNEKTWEKITW